MTRKNVHHQLLIFLLPFLFFSCNTTSKLSRQLSENPLPYIIEDNVHFNKNSDEESEPTKYIFLRLYDPAYSNPLYIANVLKGGIQITEISDEVVSHASINTSLQDNYCGLTAGGKFNFAQESCTDVKGHKYMGKCDPKTSTQITFALQVTQEEYDNIQTVLDAYLQDSRLSYNAFLTFKIGIFDIGRKFFTPKKKQQFGNSTYLPTVRKKDVKNFVCSTFIAYILVNNVSSVSDWFEQHKINYEYVNVSDLMQIPGVTRLFSSTWEYYNIAAQEFSEQYPDFAEYFIFE